ncbi:MAG: alpha/beta hydrolase [Hyphomicrobiales bacterium]|nr:MAG: alpha/beta hydrolase [Hyphomicrobiales bacterium]
MHRVEFSGTAGNRLVGDLHEGEEGRGPVVLLLHGGGQTRYAWEETAARLAREGLRAIALDQRGHGDSEWVEGGDYTFADYAADLVAVAGQIAQRYGSAPIVIGASLGGISGMLAEGESDGSLLSALILVDIVPRLDPNGVARITGFMRDRMEEGFASIDEAADAVAAYLPNRERPRSLEGLRKNLRLHDDGRYRWHWDPRFLSGPRSVANEPADMEARMLDAVRHIHVPVLLVRGGRSELVSEDHAREFLELVPQADYADVSGAGHMVAGDRNDVFADAVVEFLRKILV